MNIMVFDTETTGLDKPYCYNVGYVIVDSETAERLVRKDFVVEQIWHNLALFNTAYYANKRPIYIDRMRKHETIMNKWGYIMGEMIRDIRYYGITDVFAYNSNFDTKVFDFNCDWFKTRNPLDNVAIHDIWAMAQNFLITDDYKKFCDENGYFTESGNYKTSAEIMFRYWFDTDFTEEHTALADSNIEAAILFKAKLRGAELTHDYPLLRSIPRKVKKSIKIMIDGEVALDTEYISMWKKADLSLIKLKTE